MNIYLINYVCKENDNIWKCKSTVKAENPISAWNKFIKKWEKEIENGEADIPITTITEFNVSKICEASEAIF